jgi:co-chaperonin GroES (HSP10)
MALTDMSLLDVVARAEKEAKGQVLSITPVLEGREPYFVVRVVVGDKVIDSKYGLFGDDDDDDEGHEQH